MKAALVGVSEYLPYNLWIMYFLDGQGYELMNSIVYQGKRSAIIMEINGGNYCTGSSRNISIRTIF